MLNYQSVKGNGEQGKERRFCHNIQKYGLFISHGKLYEIFFVQILYIMYSRAKILNSNELQMRPKCLIN